LNLTDTIDLVELMVVILGAIGLTISLIMVAYIQGDRRVVRKSGTNGISKRLTNADLRNELSRTYKFLCFVAIGLMSMLIQPHLRESGRIVGDILKWMLISWEVIAVVNSLHAYVDRKHYVDYLRGQDEAKRAAAIAQLQKRVEEAAK
jgi:hypothetical protein